MRKRYESQSALEYLLTYGWTALVIAIVLVTIFSVFGFRPSVPFACLGQPGFLCSNPMLSSSGALTINLSYNGYNYPITITGLSCNVTPSSKPPSVETTYITVNPNQHQRLEFQCPIQNTGISSTDSVYLWIYYNTPTASGLEQQFGKGVLAVQYSGLQWNVTEWKPSSTAVDLLPYANLVSNPASPTATTVVNSIVWSSFGYQGGTSWAYSTDYHNHDLYNGIEVSLFPIMPLSLDDAPCNSPYESHGYTATAFVNMSGTYTFTTWADDGTEIFYKPIGGSWISVFGGTAWLSQPPTEYTSPITVSKGKYELAVDYIDTCDPAGLSVVMISPSPQAS
jgi:hypothetical protein